MIELRCPLLLSYRNNNNINNNNNDNKTNNNKNKKENAFSSSLSSNTTTTTTTTIIDPLDTPEFSFSWPTSFINHPTTTTNNNNNNNNISINSNNKHEQQIQYLPELSLSHDKNGIEHIGIQFMSVLDLKYILHFIYTDELIESSKNTLTMNEILSICNISNKLDLPRFETICSQVNFIFIYFIYLIYLILIIIIFFNLI